jgi:hypothetical protein
VPAPILSGCSNRSAGGSGDKMLDWGSEVCAATQSLEAAGGWAVAAGAGGRGPRHIWAVWARIGGGGGQAATGRAGRVRARQPGWRRAKARSQRANGSSSRSSWSSWPSAVATCRRLAKATPPAPASRGCLGQQAMSGRAGRGGTTPRAAAACRRRADRPGLAQPHQHPQHPAAAPVGSRPGAGGLVPAAPQQLGVGPVGLGPPLGPPRAAVSAGSARHACHPTACSSWTTNRQPARLHRERPVVVGRLRQPPAQPSAGRRRALARWAWPVARSTQSKVICRRRASRPPTMLTGTSFELRPCAPARSSAPEPEEVPAHRIFGPTEGRRHLRRESQACLGRHAGGTAGPRP